MRQRNVPAVGARYWVVIALASVFGANMGDTVAHVLHLGHIQGLPVLAALLAAVLLGERRSGLTGEGWYWAAIVIVRTAATNVGDLTTHDMHWPVPAVLAAFAALLAAIIARRRGDMLTTDGWYWAGMLFAGILGTVLGDYAADATGLGTGVSAFVFAAATIALLAMNGRIRAGAGPGYWLAIVLIRTTGTNIGDLLVDGLDIGLPQTTALTGLAMGATLLAWRRDRLAPPIPSAGD